MKLLQKCRKLGICGGILTTLLLAGRARAAVPPPASEFDASLDPDGRVLAISVPGLISIRGAFAATVEIGGAIHGLSSEGGAAQISSEALKVPTPYGEAAFRSVVVRHEEERIDLHFRFGRVAGVPGVVLQSGIRNAGDVPVRLIGLTPLVMDGASNTGRTGRAANRLKTAGLPKDWLITGLFGSAEPTALDDVMGPVEILEAGGIYRADGQGVLFGPVGPPTAYVAARFVPALDSSVMFSLSCDMSGAQVDPGETRWGQQIALLMEPPRPAIARWADWVGRTHGARTSKGALSGWNNWNFRVGKTIEKEVQRVMEAVESSGGRLRPAVVQFDESVQPGVIALDAPWTHDLAKRVNASGARFGVRLDFDQGPRLPAPWDPTGMAGVTGTVGRAVRNGFTYLKINCPPVPERVAGEKRTAFEIYRDDWAAIRRAAGEETYILYYSKTGANRAVVGSVDACRTGVDANRQSLRAAMNCVLRSYPLQDRWFAVDNDVYYTAGEIEGMCSVVGGWSVTKTWLSMVGLSCGTAITSDPWYWGAFEPFWRNVEVLTPPARERTEVIGLCTQRDWFGLVGNVQRPWRDSSVILLWNAWAKRVEPVPLSFDEVGIDRARRYAVWSFWDNIYLGVAKGSWRTPALTRTESKLLCFTDLDRSPDKPVVIGSNLHIYCGAAELKNVTASRRAMEIALTDAGARDGDLFVYSRWQPVLKRAVGCTVMGIGKAGENVWRISLAGRRHGEAQRVELALLLPVARQWWFWLLVVTAVGGLALAAWRHVAELRHERVHALERERARIARDIHDDLGANLAEIAMLSELAQDDLPPDAPARSRLNDIFARAEYNVRLLGEIVWAINPANDTLENFAGYLCKFTQDYLSLAGVRCRLDVPESLPALPLSSSQRHNLFLAAKEAVHNAVKHGQPSEIVLRIAADRQLTVTIEDNGRGYDEADASVRTDRGSAHMSSRMEQIGGTFVRSSHVGRGTVVTFTLPLANHGVRT